MSKLGAFIPHIFMLYIFLPYFMQSLSSARHFLGYKVHIVITDWFMGAL